MRATMVAILACLLAGPALADKPVPADIRDYNDGDTARIGVKVRIYGMDTPESKQQCLRDDACYPCGEEASEAFGRLIRDAKITVKPTGATTYDRIVAQVFANGKDVTEEMLRQGWAVAYRQYLPPSPDRDRYLAAEDDARKARRGMWAGRFDKPWDWRRGERSVCK